MKLSTASILIMFSGTAQGFSVTMSSTGYLDKLSTGSVTAPSPSWSTAPSPLPYSSPSYGSPSYGSPSYGSPSYPLPSPAPATYRSPLADLPANKDLDYLKTLGGGGSIKSGRNYSGLSSYFRQTNSGSSYLDALKGKTMAPASYSTGGYSASQGWGAPVPSPSYSGSSPTPSYSYGSSSTSPSNSYSSSSPSSSYSYGSSSTSPSYSFGGSTAPANGSYLDNIAQPVSGSSSHGTKPSGGKSAFGSYLDSL